MHSLNITLVTIAAALSSLASLSAASSQIQSPASKPAGPVQHKVAKGETMWSISQKHQTSVGEIMEFNNLGTHVVREGMTLKIPGRATVNPAKTSEAALPRPSSRDSIHIVKPGENFWTIAEKYKINPQSLAQANPNVNPNRMHPDMELTVPSPQLSSSAQKTTPANGSTTTKPTQPTSTKAGEYILAEGETFYSIAQKRGIKLSDLVAANPTLKPERLKTGTKINIPGSASNSTVANNNSTKTNSKTTSTTTASTSKPAVAKRHTVADGESLLSIAKRYSVSPDALLKQNNLKDTDSIYIGDVLNIPGASSPSTSSKTASTSSSKPAPAPSTASNSGSNTSSTSASKTTPTTKPNAQLQVANDGSVRSYIVSPGENEETICEAFGITKKELFEHNKLSQGSKLRPGDEIMIPPTTKNVVAR